jgi:hypothetical protein
MLPLQGPALMAAARGSADGHASYPGLSDSRHDPRIVGARAEPPAGHTNAGEK